MNSSNPSILGSVRTQKVASNGEPNPGSKSAQKRRRYFANKRARLDAINNNLNKGDRKFSLRTMPKIQPPKRRIVSTASVVAVEITAPAPSPAIPIIPNVISVNKTDSLEKVSVARRKAPAKKVAKAKVAKKPAKAPAKKAPAKAKVKAKAPAKKAPAKKVKLSAKEKKGLAAQPAAKLAKLAKSVNKAKAKKAPAKAKAPAKKVNKKVK